MATLFVSSKSVAALWRWTDTPWSCVEEPTFAALEKSASSESFPKVLLLQGFAVLKLLLVFPLISLPWTSRTG
jgi:hypothetical protein